MMRVHSRLYSIYLYIFICLIIVSLGIVTANAQTVVRGPYLQNGATDGISIMWRTDTSTVGRVWYGSSPGTLNQIVDEASGGVDHLARIEILTPNTKYFYKIGTNLGTVLAGGDTEHYFFTNPYIQVAQSVRIWAIGDSGTADTNAQMVRDAYLELASTDKKADLWLMLGDNAYNTGTDTEYQNAVFDMYPTILRNTILWPTQGNHDYTSNSYYSVFDLPTNGEGGGLASGTEQYYSFDYANIHFICLNSEISSLSGSPGSAMYSWLQEDLLNTSQDWIIAYFHHPPYTKGSHDSDNILDSSGRLFYMRENALPILEAGGVDLVLCGHSHSYERSFFINGHYCTSDTFYSPAHVVQPGDGKVGSDGAYIKTSTIGTVYIVGGNSGKTGAVTQHNAMQAWLSNLGSVVIDVDGLTMNVSFLRELTGPTQFDDYFTISKLQVQPPSAPGNLTAVVDSENQIILSWSDVLDETGYKIERSEDEQNWSEIATMDQDSTTYSDTNNIRPSTTYYYRVVAYNNGGNSPPSNTASAVSGQNSGNYTYTYTWNGDGNGLDDIIVDLGPVYGIWSRMNNSTWTQMHTLSPETMTIGDMDGNGNDEVIIDFGDPYGIWIRMNNSTWVQLHTLSPETMTTGDIDGNGKDEVIIDFGDPYGIWIRMNNSTWVQLHTLSPETMTTGDIDGGGKDEVIIDFGDPNDFWIRMNNSAWSALCTP